MSFLEQVFPLPVALILFRSRQTPGAEPVTTREGASLEFIMRSGYTRHLTRVIGLDMVRGSQEHEGARYMGPLNVYDSDYLYIIVQALEASV